MQLETHMKLAGVEINEGYGWLQHKILQIE